MDFDSRESVCTCMFIFRWLWHRLVPCMCQWAISGPNGRNEDLHVSFHHHKHIAFPGIRSTHTQPSSQCQSSDMSVQLMYLFALSGDTVYALSHVFVVGKEVWCMPCPAHAMWLFFGSKWKALESCLCHSCVHSELVEKRQGSCNYLTIRPFTQALLLQNDCHRVSNKGILYSTCN